MDGQSSLGVEVEDQADEGGMSTARSHSRVNHGGSRSAGSPLLPLGSAIRNPLVMHWPSSSGEPLRRRSRPAPRPPLRVAGLGRAIGHGEAGVECASDLHIRRDRSHVSASGRRIAPSDEQACVAWGGRSAQVADARPDVDEADGFDQIGVEREPAAAVGHLIPLAGGLGANPLG